MLRLDRVLFQKYYSEKSFIKECTMKAKGTNILIAIVTILVLVVGIFLIFHSYLKRPASQIDDEYAEKIMAHSFEQPGGLENISKLNLVERLKDQYSADDLSLYAKDYEGVFKKKIRINNEFRNALVLLTPNRIEETVNVPFGAHLRFGFGIWEDSYGSEGEGVQFNLHVKNKDGIRKVFSEQIDPKHNVRDRRWFDVDLDLEGFVHQEVTLIFEVFGSSHIVDETSNEDDFAVISDPRIEKLNETKINQDYNIILISIDTLRADHLRCYGYKREDISPYIDQLAEEGVLFENAISQAPWTIPSHMSMLTSLLPSYHRVNESYEKFLHFLVGRGSGYRILPEDIPTLPEILRKNGFNTFAITSGGTVAGKLGFFKGFDVFKEIPLLENLDQVEQFIKEHQNRNFFMFLHTMRVHAPYSDLHYAHEVMKKKEVHELEEFINGIVPDSIEGISDVPFENDRVLIIAERKKLIEMELFTKNVTETLYDGGIKETDEFIGQLMESLKKLGIMNHTIIIVTSDHGEEFGDHNPMYYYDWHGRSLYDEMVRVPLIFVLPDRFQKGKRVEDQVRLIDIMPTLLEFISLPFQNSDMQGASLLPILKGESVEDELLAISEAISCGPESKSIRNNKFKYIYTVDLEDEIHGERAFISDHPDREELYDLLEDPFEKYNVLLQHPDLSASLKKEINETFKDAVSGSYSSKDEKRVIVDEEMRRRLKALGYIK